MSGRRVLAFLPLALIYTLFCSSSVLAQLPEKLQRCLPYPTFAQEIDAMKQDVELKTAAKAPVRKVVVIDSVEFDGPISLPDSAQEKMVAEREAHEFDAGSKWLDEVAEVPIRGAWLDQGYFKVVASANARVVEDNAARQHVALIVHVDEGLQYFLGKVEFQSTDPEEPLVFAPEDLRKLVLLREGDLFDADKIRDSLKALSELYASEGYIDFSAEPDFEIDDEHQCVSLSIGLDQQKQFHITSVEALGLDANTEIALRSIFKPGDMFNLKLLDQFFEEHKSALPEDASREEDVTLKKNVRDGTVDMRFNFFRCPDTPD